MSISGSKNPGRTELVGPYDSVFFSSSFTDRVGKWFAVWPEFINHIKLVFWSYPFLRKTFHYWVIFCKRDNRIFSLVFMPTAGNTEKFPPELKIIPGCFESAADIAGVVPAPTAPQETSQTYGSKFSKMLIMP